MSVARTLHPATRAHVRGTRDVTLVDLLDRLLGGGVVLQGHVTLAAADVDLVDIDIALLVASTDEVSAP